MITEHFHFHKRYQAAHESIADFDAALRKLAVHCKFGKHLQETLRDRFVCGLRHKAIQRCLLTKSTLTYAKAIEIARGMESADKDAKTFKMPVAIIKKLSTSPQKSNEIQINCYRCGRANHTPAQCKFSCLKCKNLGHIAPACRSTRPMQQKQTDTR